MKRLKPLLKKLALGLGVVLIAFTFLILEENIRGRVALHSYIRQLRSQGEKLTLAELDLPRSPKEGNAAVTELVAAGKELDALQKDCPFGFERLSGFTLANSKPRNLGVFVVRHLEPDLGAPRHSQRPGVQLPATWDDLADQVRRASNALAHVRGALAKPDLAVSLDYSHVEDKEFPHLSALRNDANWLDAAALSDLQRQQLDGAVENISCMATLTRFQRHEPLFTSQYWRLHAARMGINKTWEALQAAGVTEDQLTLLQLAWEGHDFTDTTIASLETERARRLREFENNRRSLEAFWKVCWGEMSCCHECGNGDCGLKDFWFDAQAISRVVLWRLAWLDQDELEFLKGWQVCLDQAREAIAQGDCTRFRSSRFPPTLRRSRYDSWRFLMSRQLEPSDEMMVLQPMCVETERRMTIVAIALKRYERAHGGWPDSLVELTPTFLTDVPRDLMDGQPLRYRRNEDRTFTLYSVGQNCVDDGGSVERDRDHLPNGMMWMTCDAVWPMPASSAEIDAAQSKR